MRNLKVFQSLSNTAIIFIVFFITYACKFDTCQFSGIKTLYINRNIDNKSDTSYTHYVLLRGFSKTCIDSSTIVNISARYRDTCRKKPNIIMLYQSESKFVSGTIPSYPDLETDCLVKISYDENTNKPENFLFYNDKGKIIQWNKRWLIKK